MTEQNAPTVTEALESILDHFKSGSGDAALLRQLLKDGEAALAAAGEV